MSVASRVRGACAALTLCSAIGMSPPATAAEMPAYMGIMVAGPSPGETARQNVLALNAAMFGLYGNSGKVFGRNILAQHPVILGLFTGEGGRFILYRPEKATLAAVKAFSESQGPVLKKIIAWAARDPGRSLDGRAGRVESA